MERAAVREENLIKNFSFLIFFYETNINFETFNNNVRS